MQNMKRKVHKKEVRPPRKTIEDGAESLHRLTTMLWNRQHGHQMFAVLLLREVRLFRESELKLKSKLEQLKDILNARGVKETNATPSSLRGSEDGVQFIIGQPMASLPGVDGANADHIEDSVDDNNDSVDEPCIISTPPRPSLPRPSLAPDKQYMPSTVAEHSNVVMSPGSKRCRICGNSVNNDNCHLCGLQNTGSDANPEQDSNN